MIRFEEEIYAFCYREMPAVPIPTSKTHLLYPVAFIFPFLSNPFAFTVFSGFSTLESRRDFSLWTLWLVDPWFNFPHPSDRNRLPFPVGALAPHTCVLLVIPLRGLENTFLGPVFPFGRFS